MMQTMRTRFTSSELVAATRGVLRGAEKGVTGVSIDTRTLRAGELYIAIIGKSLDGHRFVDEAWRKGAVGVVVNQGWKDEIPAGAFVLEVEDTTRALGDIAAFHRRRFNPIVFGITGSNGKSTTKEMLAAMLGSRFRVLKPQSSFNNDIGVPLTVLALDAQVEAAVIEMEMNILGGIRRLCEIARPDIGIVTNIGDTHLEFLHDRQGVMEEKAELVEAISMRNAECGMRNGAEVRNDGGMRNAECGMRNGAEVRNDGGMRNAECGLRNDEEMRSAECGVRNDGEMTTDDGRRITDDGPPRNGVAVLNADDPLVMEIGARFPGVRQVTFGTGEGADWRADEIVSLGEAGVRFRVNREFSVTLPVPGVHNVHNALAALAAATAAGLSVAEALDGLRDLQPLPLRLQVERIAGGVLIADCYNANPQSMAAALAVLKDAPGRPRIAVLGDMRELGPGSSAAHFELGRQAGAVADFVLARGDFAGQVVAGALAAGRRPEQAMVLAGQAGLVDKLVDILEAGYTILVKGSRTNRMEEIVGEFRERLKIAPSPGLGEGNRSGHAPTHKA